MSTAVTSRRSQFAYFVLHKVRETRFRLDELLEVCETSRQRFLEEKPTLEDQGRRVNYHFASLSALVQALKDALPVLTADAKIWSSLASIRHIAFMQTIRNAITHDGNPVINLWADGRFYVACDFVRLGRNGASTLVTAPPEDIAKIALEFAVDLSDQLTVKLAPLAGESALNGPLYGAEFFRRAVEHPAIPAFAKELMSEADLSNIPPATTHTVSEIRAELHALNLHAAVRLERISA